MDSKANIDWSYRGKTDFSMGTDAHKTEKAIGWVSSLIVPIFIISQLLKSGLDWNYIQIGVALLIAFDISGGLVCNSLNSCKRFYHTPLKQHEGKVEALLKNHVLFSSLHIHPIVISLLYSSTWTYGLKWYFIFMLCVLAVYFTPLYLKRPVAMLLIMLAVLLNLYIIPPVKGFEWLIPLLFIKIVYGHLVREEPYRKC